MKLRKIIFGLLSLFLSFLSLKSQDVQWANKLLGYSSEYSSTICAAKQALGEPSVADSFGLSECAWMPSSVKGTDEWLWVGFEVPVNVRQICVNENYLPGAVIKIYLYDSLQNDHMVFLQQSEELNKEKGGMKNIYIKKTPYKVYSLKLFIKPNKSKAASQIDAIGISENEEPVTVKLNEPENSAISSEPENLGPNINSKAFELAPIISPDGKTIFFTRDEHPENIGSANSQDIWFSTANENGNFTLAKNIGRPINNEMNNFMFSITPDGNAILLGNVYLPNGKMSNGISISYASAGGWSFPKEVKIKKYYNRYKTVGNHCLVSSGKVLLLSVQRDDSYGGLDLYACYLQPDSSWSEPFNLGPDINTAADEISPFIAADGVTLYYSTSGFPGYGDNDMFISKRKDESWLNWTKPQNMGKSINTNGWDAHYTINASGEFAYYVSDKNPTGKSDIMRIKLPKGLKPAPVCLVSGKVINSKTNEPLEAKIIYEILPDGNEAGIAQSNPVTGEYKIVLPAGKQYGFLAEAKGFVAVNQNLDLTNVENYEEINRDLRLVPIEIGQTVVLNNIFFEFAEYELLEASFSELNRIAKFLKDNPNVKIEIRGHTDNVGSSQNNLILSQNRAISVAYYLINQGIDKKRIVTKGFGEKKPVADNDTDENRQKNRRVEFVIVNNK